MIKPFILKCIKFVTLCFLTYIFLIWLWAEFASKKHKPNLLYNFGGSGYTYTRLVEIENYSNLDILFIGSSHAYRGFDTEIFRENNYYTFNLGSSSQTPIQIEILLNKYINKLNPKLIIIEVYPWTFTSDGLESTLDIIANSKNFLLNTKLMLNQKHIKSFNSYIYWIYNYLALKNSDFVQPKIIKDHKYIDGGYVKRDLDYFTPEKSIEKKEWIFNNKQFEALGRIVKNFRTDSTKILLVQAPITKFLYNSYNNNSEFDMKISKYGKYINFNHISELVDTTDFYNDDHLNQNGVEKFNRDLIEILNQLNL